MKKLKEPVQPPEQFVESARLLGSKLGPVLVQLPPGWHVNVERLKEFVELLPEDLRWAVEFRDRSWLCREIYDVLEAAGVAMWIHDLLERHPRHLTADWTYLRYHGSAAPREKYPGGYSPQALAGQAGRIASFLREGVDVYACFNNDVDGHAVQNARDPRGFVEHKTNRGS
jgi:uncharacterized protein YecE (DUF72 family)